MTEAEKRERRALERKLSEMEEELKVSIDFVGLERGDILCLSYSSQPLIGLVPFHPSVTSPSYTIA